MPPIMKSHHCKPEADNKYLRPKTIKIQPPIFGHFQDARVIIKTAKARSPCIKESRQVNSGPKPSKIKMAKKPTTKIESARGR